MGWGRHRSNLLPGSPTNPWILIPAGSPGDPRQRLRYIFRNFDLPQADSCQCVSFLEFQRVCVSAFLTALDARHFVPRPPLQPSHLPTCHLRTFYQLLRSLTKLPSSIFNLRRVKPVFPSIYDIQSSIFFGSILKIKPTRGALCYELVTIEMMTFFAGAGIVCGVKKTKSRTNHP